MRGRWAQCLGAARCSPRRRARHMVLPGTFYEYDERFFSACPLLAAFGNVSRLGTRQTQE